MVSTLNITVCEKQGRSYLKDVFVTPPFRVVPVGQYKKDGSSYLMIMSTSPGILNGDEYRMNVHIKEHARLQLQSQSYQRLYSMEDKASLQMDVTLERGAAFSYVPHPVVPHEYSFFTSNNNVFLQDDCELLMSEIITCGRKHCGELFRYRHFQNQINVYHLEKLVLKDNVLLQPQQMPLDGTGLLEGYTHQGTLIYLNTKGKPVQDLIEYFFSEVSRENDIAFGISAMRDNGFVLRILGNGGEQLYSCFLQIQQYLWEDQFADIKVEEEVVCIQD